MSDYEFLEGRDLQLILKDLNHAVGNKRVQFDEQGRMIFNNLTIGGVFTSWGQRDERVQLAMDEGDIEKEWWLRNALLAGQTRPELFDFSRSDDPNMLPTLGLDFVNNICFHSSQSKIATWYHGPFVNNATVDLTWTAANWAGGGSPKATELPSAQYGGGTGTRVVATFANVSSGGVIQQSTNSDFVFHTGVSNVTVYGGTLNSVNTVLATTGILASATNHGAKGPFSAADTYSTYYKRTLANA
jgi:hypothetical protein